MRIGIDARFYGPGGRGLGRYTAELVRHLEAESATGDEFIVFLRQSNYDAYSPERPNFLKVLADFPWYSITEQARFPVLIREARVELMHFLHFNVPVFSRTPYVVTIHDLILKRYPTVAASTRAWPLYFLKRLGYHAVISAAVRRARTVIAVSDFTKSQIISAWPRVRGRTVVIPEGVSVLTGVAEPRSAVLQRYGISRPYFLYVGSCYPHKNVAGLVSAYRVLQGLEPAAPDLVLVGSRDRFSDRLAQAVRAAGIKRVHFVGFVPDSDLNTLYEAAVAYVCPSLYEGFGLPPLEALAAGTRVLAHRGTALSEVLGEAAFFTDARDPVKFAHDMRALTVGERRAPDFPKEKFSWAQTAAKTYAVYRQALGDVL